MRKSPYGSLIVAMVTPFKEDLAVDYEQGKKLALCLAGAGVDGVLISGTTGESPTLTTQEKLRLVEDVKETVSSSVTVWGGSGTNDTRSSVELTGLFDKAGADGILAVTPYYNKPSQEGLYHHFKSMAEATDLPIMLYNVPSRTGVNLMPDTVLRLAEIDNIVCIKEASGNVEQSSRILKDCRDGFYVYSGDDSLTLPILSVGGSGVVSVAAHLVAKEMRRMIDLFYQGSVTQAVEIHRKLYPLFKALFVTSNPVPVKTALQEVGVKVGGVRLPLYGPSQKEKGVILRTLEGLGIVDNR